MENTKVKISKVLKDLGISPSLRGFDYLKEAIERTMADRTLLRKVTSRLYPNIAEKFDTTGSRVERAMRHAIECGIGRGDLQLMEAVFGYVISPEKGKATNSEFIACVVDYMECEK